MSNFKNRHVPPIAFNFLSLVISDSGRNIISGIFLVPYPVHNKAEFSLKNKKSFQKFTDNYFQTNALQLYIFKSNIFMSKIVTKKTSLRYTHAITPKHVTRERAHLHGLALG